MPSVSSKQHRLPSREEIAWAAGVFCGEGSVTVHRPRRFIGVRLTVGQSSDNKECPEMLVRLRRIFGGRVYEMKWRKLAHHKTIWQFYVHNFEQVQAIVAMMWGFLTPEKRAQATEAFRTYHAERAQKAIRNYAPRGWAQLAI